MIRRITLLILVLLSLGILIGAGLPAGKDITLEFTRTSQYARTNFNHAYTMVWCGDVTLKGKKVGEFTASLTKTNKTGANGAVQQYDVIIPDMNPIADFFSIRTNHIVTGAGADHGVVFATSPEYKFLNGATVEMKGKTTRIAWDSGGFPVGSPLAP